MIVSYLEGSRTEREWKTDRSWEKLLKWRTVCKKSLCRVGYENSSLAIAFVYVVIFYHMFKLHLDVTDGTSFL
jgi:hypothetical protein